MSAPFNPDAAAESLNEAIKGLGTDDKELIRVISSLTHEQRTIVATTYKAKFGHELIDDVHGDTSGNYRGLLEKLILPFPEAMARCLHEAISGLGTNDHQLITLIVGFPDLLPAAAEAYKRLYKHDLVKDIKGDTSGNYEKTLVALIERRPPPAGFVDTALIPADVEAFYKAGEGRLGTDEKKYIEILVGRSNAHIVEVDKVYTKTHKHTLAVAISKETSGHFEDVLTALVTPRFEYLAKAVQHAVDGAGTEERLLHIVFALCTREELLLVNEEFRKLYQLDMAHRIEKDTSFNFKKLLVSLL